MSQVSINRASVLDVPVWEVADGSSHVVAEVMAQGGEIRAICATNKNDTASFKSADWVFVGCQHSTKQVAVLLEHSFTINHASVAWVGSEERGMSDCVLGFRLPHTLSDARRYTLLLSGLATIYAAVRPRSAVHAWRCASGGTATELSGSLDEAAISKLEALGRENSAHRGKGGYVRSAVALDRDVIVRKRDGEVAVLASLDEGTAIFCPVHADADGVATVIGQGNIKAVQCPVCLRNYWNVPPQREVDFDQFRRMFDELYDQESRELESRVGTFVWDDERQFKLLREQYLPKLEFKRGVTLVRSPKGSGKTTVLKDLVNQCSWQGLSVLLVGHRRALLRDQSQRIDLDLYFETLDGVETSEFRAVKPTDRYAICLDSVPSRLRPDVHKFDVVLVDESEQVIRHLAGTTLKEERRQAFLKFMHYLNVAKAVYLLDADLGMLSMSLVTNHLEVGKDVHIIVNEPEVEQREYELVTTREGLMGKLEAALDEGKKCYLATNSKTAAEKTAAWAAKRWKEKRIELVISKNSQEQRIQDLLCNVVEEYQTGRNGKPPLDLLIGSPAIGTGIDITFPENAVVVDHVFGLFQSNITTHFDIDQQLGRVRHPGKVSVWVNRNVMHYETSSDALRNELRNTVLRTDVLVGFSRNGLPIYSEADKPLVGLWSEIVSYERASKNDLSRHWTALREANGWTAILCTASDAEKERGKAALLDGAELHEKARVETLLEAEDIDDLRADELKELAKVGAAMSEEDQAALEKYRMSDFYATEVNEDLVAFDDDGRTRGCIDLLEVLVGDSESNRSTDRLEIDRKDKAKVIVFDRQYRSAKSEMLVKLLSTAGFLDAESGQFLTETLVNTENLGDFVACFREHRKRIEAELGVDMRRDIERKPVQQLGDILALIGLELVMVSTKKVKGVKLRSYAINVDLLMALMDVVVRRDTRRQERIEQWKSTRNSAGDNAPPLVNNDYEDQLSLDDRGASCSATSSIAARVAASRRSKQSTTAPVKKSSLTNNGGLDPFNLPFQV